MSSRIRFTAVRLRLISRLLAGNLSSSFTSSRSTVSAITPRSWQLVQTVRGLDRHRSADADHKPQTAPAASAAKAKGKEPANT